MGAHQGSRLGLVPAALFAAFSAASYAQEDKEVLDLVTPVSTISGGIGYATDDAPRFGQYNGIRDEGLYLLLDGEYRRRIDATGTWVILSGRNLGLDNRELRFDHNRQGNWGYFIEFGQTPRYEPFTPVTGLTGIGTSTQVINGTSVRPVELDTRRDTFSLGFDKFIAGNFDFQLRFRNEEKEGARLFGQGDNPGTPNTRFLTDSIDYTIRQWEAIANYTTQRLQLSAGYYGTLFDNKIPALTISGVPAAIFTPMALPPGNQSHQVYLTGGYSFTPTTRATFKVAHARQTQDDGFVAAAVNGRAHLDGRVDTTLAQLGFSAQPLQRLSLLANLRYEDRNDKTPTALYFTGSTATATLSGENEPRSIRSTSGKVEAGYQLPMGFRLTGGIDYEEKDRNTFRVRSVSHRDTTKETSYRAEIRRSIGETLTGSLSYVYSDRDGSSFLLTVVNSGAPGSNLVAPIHLADRERNKVRANLTWMPIDPLAVQLMYDEGRDRYDGRTAADLGTRDGRLRNYSVDASYSFSEAVQANAWYSRNTVRVEQASLSGATTAASNIANASNSFGVGARAQLNPRLEVSGDLQYTDIEDNFNVVAIAGPTPVSLIPDINTRLTTLQILARYAFQTNIDVRVNYVYDRWKSDEWTWTNFVYTDGTRVVQSPSQKVQFIGVAVSYQWR